ncbi:P-type conjugative transfer protein TrbG [Diaphorobacter nitroreducens]|uniref:P-type conjugative transfer protein TrbG n=1 Tax=Diaphorobacter nitroreducens TaxID=164759 RepID=UPI00289B4B52|nr:P-type conjugative transfer protein TrbG [Diaphorobacter nitroreducens]
MNTVSHSEVQALHAVAAAAGETSTVPVTAPYELHLIALSKLRPSARNVRKSGGTAIPELAASIVRVGLLQNLTVIAAPDGEHFEVVAGKRRLAALKLLAKRRKLGKDHPVPCLLVPDASARTVSLTENVHRDTVRWIVGDTSSGSGDALRVNVLVKPVRSGLKTNLVITTNRRTYLIELTSTEKAWMASVSWDYPKDRMLALQRQAQAAQASAPVDTGLSLERIRFRYAISGSSPPWKPLRAFDDGEKVYIQFPAGIVQGELPPLFVIGAQGDGQLVNYRFRPPYYIVDRLFGAAELRLGADKGDAVRIERTDGVSAASASAQRD